MYIFNYEMLRCMILEIVEVNELVMKRRLKYSSLERDLTFHMNSSSVMAVVVEL